MQTLGGETVTDIDLDREFFTLQANAMSAGMNMNVANSSAMAGAQLDSDGLYGMKKVRFFFF
jgi:hypothetical protein